jgi:ParB family chromosome partitioning protein
LELALIENLEREDLNIIEEAEGYRALLDRFGLTQEQVAERVGRGRATVANALRLLDLPEDLRQALAEKALSPGHAKVLLQLPIPAEQRAIAKRVIREGLSVRALEKLVARVLNPPGPRRAARTDIPEDHLRYLIDRLHHCLGTGVRVQPTRTLANGRKAKGTLEIDFHSPEELNRLLGLLGLEEQLP